MKWTVDLADGDVAVLEWTAGRLASEHPDLVETVERYAQRNTECSPIVGTLIPVGLADSLEAWATITCAMAETYTATLAPEPPLALTPAGDDLVF